MSSIYEILDLSPAGAGSSNGTMLGLDREYHARLLGFNGLVTHTKDATWASDSFCSISNWINLFSGMLCKMTEDFLNLCNDGFKVIQCADKHSRISVIMPHKKNPYQLSICRGKFLEISAKANLYLSALAKSSGYPDSRHVFYKELPRDIEELKNNITMLRDVILLFKINEEESNKLVFNKNIYTADMSQELLVKYKITDREAHKIMSEIITYTESQSKELNITSINSILKTKGLPSLKQKDFDKLTDPNYILSRRSEIGSANPENLIDDVSEINQSIRSSSKKIFEKKIDLFFLNSELKNFSLN
jgi:argininosuccinate lyase